MDNDKKDRGAKAIQILPEPEKSVGLSTEEMARVLKAAQEHPQTDALNRKRQSSSNPSPAMLEMKAHAEHLAGTSFSMDELQPHRPSLAAQRNARSKKSQTPPSSES